MEAETARAARPATRLPLLARRPVHPPRLCSTGAGRWAQAKEAGSLVHCEVQASEGSSLRYANPVGPRQLWTIGQDDSGRSPGPPAGRQDPESVAAVGAGEGFHDLCERAQVAQCRGRTPG